MDINKKNRTELKNYFLANKIPTQKNFEELVDANLNQAEDGIAKVQGSPIALQSEGDSAGTQEVLNLFSSFADANPNWSLNLNPRVDPTVPASNKPGLNFKDATGKSHLFIKSGGGDVGIGTIEPKSRLSIQAREDASMISVISETTGGANIFEVSQEDNNGVLALRNASGTLVSKLSGTANKSSFFLSKVGVGTDAPLVNLHVSGEAAELRITNTTSGHSPHLTIQSSSGKAWDISSDEGNGNLLRISPAGVGEKGITISRDGKVNALGGVNFGERASHLNEDGSMYRLGGKLYLSIDDDFFIRDIGGAEKVHLNTNTGRMAIGGTNPAAPLSITGEGKGSSPDGRMHITSGCILFGGPNTSIRNVDSAQISAGKHKPNSLNIVGMSTGSSSTNRKVDFWAEGGMTVRGHIKSPSIYVVAFSVSLSVHTSGNRNPLSFGQINFNVGGHFKANNHFQAPVKGLYIFTLHMRNNSGDDVAWRLRLNGSGHVNGGGGGGEISERTYVRSRLDNHSASRTVITVLKAGDKVHVQQDGGRNDNYSSGWDGALLQAME